MLPPNLCNVIRAVSPMAPNLKIGRPIKKNAEY